MVPIQSATTTHTIDYSPESTQGDGAEHVDAGAAGLSEHIM